MTEEEIVIENPESIEVKLDKGVSPCRNIINILSQGFKQDKNINTRTPSTTLLILNQTIDIGKLFIKLWDNSCLRVCADGAANRVYDFFQGEEERRKHIPDYIIGDLDSIDKEVLNYYRSLNVKIIKQTTQYSTDFTKCVNLISLHHNSRSFREYLQKNESEPNYGIELESGIHNFYDDMMQKVNRLDLLPPMNLIVVNGIGGRFDQTIHSVTQLYTLKESDPYFQTSFITSTDIIVLIPKGGTMIEYECKMRKQCIGNCGLLPIGKPTTIIETCGLKWDVKNWHTSISSGKVSSNNRFVGQGRCYINVEDDLVLNIEVYLDKLIEYIYT